MDNRLARKFGRFAEICGCVLVILNQLWLGIALFAAGLLLVIVLGRCPHCHRVLLATPVHALRCPRCDELL